MLDKVAEKTKEVTNDVQSNYVTEVGGVVGDLMSQTKKIKSIIPHNVPKVGNILSKASNIGGHFISGIFAIADCVRGNFKDFSEDLTS